MAVVLGRRQRLERRVELQTSFLQVHTQRIAMRSVNRDCRVDGGEGERRRCLRVGDGDRPGWTDDAVADGCRVDSPAGVHLAPTALVVLGEFAQRRSCLGYEQMYPSSVTSSALRIVRFTGPSAAGSAALCATLPVQMHANAWPSQTNASVTG